MVGSGEIESGGIVSSYAKLRKDLDDSGYQDILPVEGLPLVQKLFKDLRNTSKTLQITGKEYAEYKKNTAELECGVGPWREENVRLIRENSHLRVAVYKTEEDCKEKVSKLSHRIDELEEEKSDLKSVVRRLTFRIKAFIKKRKVGYKGLDKEESISEDENEEKMDRDGNDPFPCRYCIKLRCSAKFDNKKDKDKVAVDYFQVADARISALQIQIKQFKEHEKEVNEKISLLKNKVMNRDREIEKLRSATISSPLTDSNKDKIDYDLNMQLKSAQIQMELLQKRNFSLERKFKNAILQEHNDIMTRKGRTLEEKNLLRNLAALDVQAPTHPDSLWNYGRENWYDKVAQLEIQLQNCIKEKVALKQALERCENRNRVRAIERRDYDGLGEKQMLLTNNVVDVKNTLRSGKEVSIPSRSTSKKENTAKVVAPKLGKGTERNISVSQTTVKQSPVIHSKERSKTNVSKPKEYSKPDYQQYVEDENPSEESQSRSAEDKSSEEPTSDNFSEKNSQTQFETNIDLEYEEQLDQRQQRLKESREVEANLGKDSSAITRNAQKAKAAFLSQRFKQVPVSTKISEAKQESVGKSEVPSKSQSQQNINFKAKSHGKPEVKSKKDIPPFVPRYNLGSKSSPRKTTFPEKNISDNKSKSRDLRDQSKPKPKSPLLQEIPDNLLQNRHQVFVPLPEKGEPPKSSAISGRPLRPINSRKNDFKTSGKRPVDVIEEIRTIPQRHSGTVQEVQPEYSDGEEIEEDELLQPGIPIETLTEELIVPQARGHLDEIRFASAANNSPPFASERAGKADERRIIRAPVQQLVPAQTQEQIERSQDRNNNNGHNVQHVSGKYAETLQPFSERQLSQHEAQAVYSGRSGEQLSFIDSGSGRLLPELEEEISLLHATVRKLKRNEEEMREEIERKTKKIDQLNSECDEKTDAVESLRLKLNRVEMTDRNAKTGQAPSATPRDERINIQGENYRLSNLPTDRHLGERRTMETQTHIVRDERLERPGIHSFELEDEIFRLRASLQKLDREKDTLRSELEGKNEKVSRLGAEVNSHLQEISRLRGEQKSSNPFLAFRNKGPDSEAEVQSLKRQIEYLRKELETIGKERDEAKREIRRLAVAVPQAQLLNQGGWGSMRSHTQDRASTERQIQPMSSARDQYEAFESARKLRQQAAREQDLEEEISRLQSIVARLDRDKDEMRAELDRKDERLARISQDGDKQIGEVSNLKMALKNAEYQLSQTGNSARDQEREMAVMKRQLENLRADLESATKERDEAIKDCRRLAGAFSKEEIERRSVSQEFEKKVKEADDLRKQVAKYIEEVRRIEDILLQKEDELDSLMEQFRALSAEKDGLESERAALEKEASSIRDGVRETIDLNNTFKNQLASQTQLLTSYEQEIEKLSQSVATLENQVSTFKAKEKELVIDTKASTDMLVSLETKMDSLKLNLSNAEGMRNKLEAENEELRTHIKLLEEQILSLSHKERGLEERLESVQDKEQTVSQSVQSLSVEKDELNEKLKSLQMRWETVNEEVRKFRLKSTQLQSELEKTKRQFQAEKVEKDNALSELKKAQEQVKRTAIPTSPQAQILVSPSSPMTDLPVLPLGSSAQTIGGMPAPATDDKNVAQDLSENNTAE